MQQQAEEEELGLSSLALAALKEFALENNLLGEDFVRPRVRFWPRPVLRFTVGRPKRPFSRLALTARFGGVALSRGYTPLVVSPANP